LIFIRINRLNLSLAEQCDIRQSKGTFKHDKHHVMVHGRHHLQSATMTQICSSFLVVLFDDFRESKAVPVNQFIRCAPGQPADRAHLDFEWCGAQQQAG
jgi:hypothetical protein